MPTADAAKLTVAMADAGSTRRLAMADQPGDGTTDRFEALHIGCR